MSAFEAGSTKNYEGFSIGDRVVTATKANPIWNVGTIEEIREEKVAVVWDRSPSGRFYHPFELVFASPDDTAFEGTHEEWREENDRRQGRGVGLFFESHTCTPGCLHSERKEQTCP